MFDVGFTTMMSLLNLFRHTELDLPRLRHLRFPGHKDRNNTVNCANRVPRGVTIKWQRSLVILRDLPTVCFVSAFDSVKVTNALKAV